MAFISKGTSWSKIIAGAPAIVSSRKEAERSMTALPKGLFLVVYALQENFMGIPRFSLTFYQLQLSCVAISNCQET